MKERTHTEHIAVMQGRHFNLLFYNMLDVFIPHATRHTHIANKIEPRANGVPVGAGSCRD